MRVIQRVSAFIGWAVFTTVGVLLVLEAIGIVDDQWRQSVGDVLAAVAAPTMEQWAAALAAVGLALLAGLIVIAQVTPYRRTTKYHVVVDEIDEGQTVLHSGAIQTAVGSVLRTINGVADASVIVGRRRADARISVIDDTNVTDAATAAGLLLDDEFWSRLGIDSMRVDAQFSFQRSHERVIH